MAAPPSNSSTPRADLTHYPLTTYPHAVTTDSGHDGHFTISLDDGTHLTARKVILATGVTDVLPDIPGMQDAWGTTAHHCPVCHGSELRHDDVALLEPHLTSAQLPGVLSHYRSTTATLLVCTQGPSAITQAERALLSAQGIELEERILRHLESVSGGLRLHFDTGAPIDRAALFIHSQRNPNTQLGEQLGCQLAPHGLFIPEPSSNATTVPGVYAAGDVSGGNQVVFALASGARAAMHASAALHHERAVALLGT